MVKLRQKISGGLRYPETFYAIRSYLSTTRTHGINALDALTRLHNGQCRLSEPPERLPERRAGAMVKRGPRGGRPRLAMRV